MKLKQTFFLRKLPSPAPGFPSLWGRSMRCLPSHFPYPLNGNIKISQSAYLVKMLPHEGFFKITTCNVWNTFNVSTRKKTAWIQVVVSKPISHYVGGEWQGTSQAHPARGCFLCLFWPLPWSCPHRNKPGAGRHLCTHHVTPPEPVQYPLLISDAWAGSAGQGGA